LRKNSRGTQLWTGSGAAIWHAPTIDPRHRAIYVATGDAYTEPAHPITDAVMAIHMDTGKVLWSVQDYENDAWLVGCAQEPNENCPKDLGPDYDFGASPILQSLPDGRRVLLAGQKSGLIFAHDPGRQGALLWKAALVEKVGESEILFGGAADQGAAYFDQRSRAVANGIWQVGRGFQISGLHIWGSGERSNTSYGGDLRNLGAGGSARLRPDGTIVPRNSFVQPDTNRTDVRFQQRIPFGDRVAIDAIAEVFNTFNRPNWNVETEESARDFGERVSGQNRTMQFGFRLTF